MVVAKLPSCLSAFAAVVIELNMPIRRRPDVVVDASLLYCLIVAEPGAPSTVTCAARRGRRVSLSLFCLNLQDSSTRMRTSDRCIFT